MSEVQKKIERLKEEILDLERDLLQKKAFLAGLQEAFKIHNKSSGAVSLRPGSEISRTADVLKKEGKPLYIDRILQALGKEPTAANRLSLAGSLSSYVRRGQIFNKPLPNTFGLIEFDDAATPAEIPAIPLSEANPFSEDDIPF